MEGRGKSFRVSPNIAVLVLVAVIVFAVTFFNFSRIGVNQSPAKASADWYDFDWSYRTTITIDYTKVPSDLTNFPVLISSTANDWKDTGNSGKVGQADGDDLLFTSSDGTTKLSHEIEKYDGATGQLIAWVKVPAVSSTVNTIIYLYYGNAGCASQQSATAVWSAYRGVWHLTEDQAGASNAGLYQDATANNFDGDDYVSDTGKGGKINLGQEFDGSDDYIEVPQNVDSSTSASTLSYWFSPTSTLHAGDGRHDIITTESTYYNIIDLDGDGKLCFIVYTNGNQTEERVCSTTTTWTAGAWYQIVATHNSSGMALYVNGTLEGSNSDSFVRSGSGLGHLKINYSAAYGLLDGNFDEVRFISGTAVSAGWAMAEKNNQNSPSTFYSLSAAEAGDTSVPINPTTFNAYNSSGKTVGLTTNNWYNYTAPHFEWSGASDPESGVKGYWAYFGTTANANPATAGTYQAHSGGVSATQSFTSSAALTSGSTYYFRLRVENNSSDPYNLSDTQTLLTYKFDSTVPAIPEYVNVSPVGCSTASSFTFTWPEVTDASDSLLAGYDYKKGSTGTVVQLSAVLTVNAAPYQEGDNVFYLRSRDNAGNTSLWQTAVYCSTGQIYLLDGPTVTAGPSSITVVWVSSKSTTSYVKVYDGNTYVSEQGETSYALSHNVKVIGLEPEKNYRYKVVWTDQSGNIDESDWYSTTTATAPQINNFKIDLLSPREFNISWSSTVAARYVLQYGIGDYGTSVTIPDTLTGYSGKLSSLTPGANYQVRVNATSDDGTKFFAGQSVIMPPYPAASALRFQPIAGRADTAITVSWSTNVETTSSVFYGPKGESKKEVSKSDRVKSHQIELANLSDNAEYEIYVTGIDQFGNIGKSETNTYTTPFDTRPPSISEISSDTSNVGSGKQDSAQITIGFNTDEPAKCQVEYAEGIIGDNYSNKIPEEDSLSTTHLVVISNLKPQTPYHYQIICKDRANNGAHSTAQTVISGEVTQSVFNIILKTLNNLFGWLQKGIK